MADDDDFNEVVRRLKKQFNIELPKDTTPATLAHDLGVVLTQLMASRDAESEIDDMPRGFEQYSAHDNPNSAKAIVDAQLAASGFLRSLHRH